MKILIGPSGVRYPVTPDVERFLRPMDRDALRSLVLEMAAYSPEAMRSLQLRATPADEPTVSELLAAVDDALAGVDLDYHDPDLTKASTTASKGTEARRRNRDRRRRGLKTQSSRRCPSPAAYNE